MLMLKSVSLWRVQVTPLSIALHLPWHCKMLVQTATTLLIFGLNVLIRLHKLIVTSDHSGSRQLPQIPHSLGGSQGPCKCSIPAFSSLTKLSAATQQAQCQLRVAPLSVALMRCLTQSKLHTCSGICS